MNDNENKRGNQNNNDWASASDWFTQRQSERINTSGGRFDTGRPPVRQNNVRRDEPREDINSAGERHNVRNDRRPEKPKEERREKADKKKKTEKKQKNKKDIKNRNKKTDTKSQRAHAGERERHHENSYDRPSQRTGDDEKRAARERSRSYNDSRSSRKADKERRKFDDFSRKNKNSGKSKDELRLEYAEKTRKRRKHKIAQWFIFTFIAFAAIFVTLSLTVLFHTSEILVEGDTRYSAEEIIGASKINLGDNLWRVSGSKTSAEVSSALPYIGSVRISRKIPSTLTLHVTETEPAYAVKSGKKYILIDKNDKILETTKKKGKAVVIDGVKIPDPVNGMKVVAENPENYATAKEIIKCAKENSLKLTRVTAKDQNNISAVCSLNIRLDFGSASQLSEKLKMANEVIEKLKEEGSLNEGVLNLKSTTKAFFKDGPINPVPVTEAPTEPQTDENGNPIEPEQTTEGTTGESTSVSESVQESTSSSSTQTAEPLTTEGTTSSIPEPPATRPQG